MADVIGFIVFCIFMGLVWVFYLRKALKDEQRRFAKQEQLIDLMIKHYEIDNKN